MKQKMNFFSGMIAMLVIVCLVNTAAATFRKITKELEYKDISVTLNGQKLDLRDAQGGIVEPFIFDGTNYLPVRALAEALGLSVAWDGNTNTIVLTSSPTSSQPSSQTNAPQATPPVNTPENVPDGWLKVDGSAAFLVEGAAKGKVIYRNGEYWAEPNYVHSFTDENIVYFEDIAGNTKTPEQNYIDQFNANTQVIPAEEWVGIEALSKIRAELGIEKIMSNQAGSAEVSDFEVLKYCMPSLPDNFMSSPVAGIYDRIRVKVENGVILMSKYDLDAQGWLQ